MRSMRIISAFFLIVFILITFFVPSCSKKEPETPKLPQKKIELPAPKPVEPPKTDVNEFKEKPKTEDNEKKDKKDEEKQQTFRKRKEFSQKPISSVITSAPKTMAKKLPQTVDFDKLNREFNSYDLNVWASELKDNEILLNGYVKSEKERSAAMSIARRYSSKITDMINIVESYNIRE